MQLFGLSRKRVARKAALVGIAVVVAATWPETSARAQAPLSNLLYTAGTVTSNTVGASLSYILLGSGSPTVLAGRRYQIFGKNGYPTNAGAFTLRGTIAPQTDPNTVLALLQQSLGLGEDFNELGNALNLLFGSVGGFTNLTLPQEVGFAVQSAQPNPGVLQSLQLVARMHPGLALCLGSAFSETISTTTTYEIRESSPSGGATYVVGRLTLTPGLVLPLPAPGAPFQPLRDDPKDHLIIRLRWGTAPQLRQLSLLSQGFNVWRIERTNAVAAGFDQTPPSPAQLASNVFTRVNHGPVVATKDFDPDTVSDPNDVETTFFADSNGRAYGQPIFTATNPPTPGYTTSSFTDGEQFYYFVTARDILGRDGSVSPAGLGVACRHLPPGTPRAPRVLNATPRTQSPYLVTSNYLQVSWQQNTNSFDQVSEYWVYRWPNPAMALTNDFAPASNRVAIVSQIAGALQNTYLDNGADAPFTPGASNYWYSIRAVSQNACGQKLLSPQSPPAWGVIRKRTGPPGASGEVLGSCGTPAVIFQTVKSAGITPDPRNGHYRFTCLRRDRAIDWVEFGVSNYTTFGTNVLLGMIHFSPDNDAISYDYQLPYAPGTSPVNPQFTVSCIVGTRFGQVSPAATWTDSALPAVDQQVEASFLAGTLLTTALSSSDPLRASFGSTVCLPAQGATAFPDGTVGVQFDPSLGQALLIQANTKPTVIGGSPWSDVGVAVPDSNGVCWISYPQCLTGPLPAFQGCLLNWPSGVNCDEHIAAAAEGGPVAPILVRFTLTRDTHEFRLYRRVDEGPLTLVSQGHAVFDSTVPFRSVVRTDDAMPVTAARHCYFVQLLDENGNAGPMSYLGCKWVKPPVLPRPILAEPHSVGSNSPQVSLNWFCPTSGVYRFQVLIARADLPGNTNTSGVASPKLSRFGGLSSAAKYSGLTGARTTLVRFDEVQLTPPIGSGFGPGPGFSLVADVLPDVPYRISVAALDAQGHASDASLARNFTWRPPLPIVSVPWPARPLPPVENFEDELSYATLQADPEYPFPRVGATLMYSQRGLVGLDPQYPVGIRIGDVTLGGGKINTIVPNVGTSNFFYWTLSGATAAGPEADPNNFLFRRASPDEPGLSGSVLPLVIYRRQVTNDQFSVVSGRLTQVTPLIESLAYSVTTILNNPPLIQVNDLLIAGGTENHIDPAANAGHYFLYLRDQQPVLRGATYEYFAVHLNSRKEIAQIIPAGTVTIPLSP